MRKDSYIETKRRLSRCFDIKNTSDKEIIEVLDNEIKQYRERIEQLQEQVKELYNREIKSETITLDTTEEDLVDKDILEIISTTQYADGKLIQSKMEYKYKDTSNNMMNNKNENAKELKAIYHAEIYETNDGDIDILYECNKDRCIECNKKNCIPEYCTHTLNKKYAKNYYNKES